MSETTSWPEPKNLAEAEAMQAQAIEALREATSRADRLAAVQWNRRQERREEWARSVLTSGPSELADLMAAETAAARTFDQACVDGDARSAYLAWIDARAAVNVQRDRITAARAILGQHQNDDGYLFRDTPRFGESVDRALSSEATRRLLDRQSDLQQEINTLDTL